MIDKTIIKQRARAGQRRRIARRIKEIRSLTNVDKYKVKEAVYSLVSLSKNYPKL